MRLSKDKWYAGIVVNKETRHKELLVLVPQITEDSVNADIMFDDIILEAIKINTGLEFRKLEKETEINGVKLDGFAAKFVKDVSRIPCTLVNTSGGCKYKDGIEYKNGMLFVYATIINQEVAKRELYK